MACLTSDREGYATAAFSVLALCFAVIAAAIMALAGSQLQSAKRRLDHTVRDAHLEGGLVLAADAVMRDVRTIPFSWTQQVDGASMVLVAEPEGLKADGNKPDTLGAAVLQALAGQPAIGEAEVLSGSLHRRRQALLGRSDRRTWRLCAQSLLSPVSASERATVIPPSEPSGDAINWRVGEIWRLVAFTDGRGADALVRFTGNPDSPMAILDLRSEAMAKPDPERCHRLATADAAP